MAGSEDTDAGYGTWQSCVCLDQLAQSSLLLLIHSSLPFVHQPRLFFLSQVIPSLELFEDLKMSIGLLRNLLESQDTHAIFWIDLSGH